MNIKEEIDYLEWLIKGLNITDDEKEIKQLRAKIKELKNLN